jgi:hypothetical protein
VASQSSSARQGHACAIRRQPPRASTCSGRAPSRQSTPRGAIRDPWRRMPATRVSRAGHTSLLRATLTSRRRRSILRSREPTLRTARADCAVAPLGRPAIRRRSGLQLPSGRRGNQLLKTNRDHNEPGDRRARLPLDARATLCLVMLAACAVALIRSRARDRGRETKDHDTEPSRTRWLQQARDALWVVMLATCTVALIRSQVLTSGPPVVPACELFVLAAVLGPKPPPPRSPKRA